MGEPTCETQLASYPGRGLVHHVDSRGDRSWIYFVTGRSSASRARRLRVEPDRVVIEPATASSAHDELRHYTCARAIVDGVVIGNGDHVDQLATEDFEHVAATLEPEPDAPLNTPRLALRLRSDGDTLVSAHLRDDQVIRRRQAMSQPRETVTVVTTYTGDATRPLGHAPSFQAAESRPVEAVATAIWDSLDREIRVLLVAGMATDCCPVLSFP